MVEEPYIKDFLDMVAPSVIDFKVDHYLCGNTCRCVWALREYPTSTDEQAILRHLGEMDGVTIRIYTRQVTPSEERRIIHNAANKHRMSRSSTEDLQQTVTAEANLQDVVTLVSSMHRNREPLLHCAVFLELTAPDYDALKLLQTDGAHRTGSLQAQCGPAYAPSAGGLCFCYASRPQRLRRPI